MNGILKKVALAAGFVAGTATMALAEGGVLDGVTLDTTTVTTLAGTVLSGLSIMWGLRKVIKLINHS